MASRVEADADAVGAGVRLAPIAPTGTPPLSYGQERLWFLDRLMPGSPTSIMAFVLRLTGALEVAALRAAFAAHPRIELLFLPV